MKTSFKCFISFSNSSLFEQTVWALNNKVFKVPRFHASGEKAITKHHLRKLDKFCRRTLTPIYDKVTFSHIRNTVHNFSNYPLSNEEYKALLFGLDYHISNQSSYNTTETEFELFYQNTLPNLSHILDNQLTKLKSKLRNACHKYNNIMWHISIKKSLKISQIINY